MLSDPDRTQTNSNKIIDTSLDEVQELLAKAAYNTSVWDAQVHPIPRNGSIELASDGFPLPASKYNHTVDPSNYVNTTAYQRCITAKNCQPVHHANGWRPSFKSGYNATHPYGNGTLSSWLSDDKDALQKRQQTGPGSLVGTTDPSTMFYGSTNPCTAFNYAYYACTNAGCSSSASVSTSYVSNGQKDTATITVNAVGEYPSYNMRDFLIAAIVAVAGQGQSWSSQAYGGYDQSPEQTLWTGTGFDSIQIALYGEQAMEGYITVSNTFTPAGNSNLCTDLVTSFTDAVWSVASLFGGLLAAVDTWACTTPASL